MSEEVSMCLACCLATISIVGVILYSVSFGNLDVHQIGLRYDDVTKLIDETGPFFAGRYFLGLGSSFKKYDSTWQLMKFTGGDIRAWTLEGQLLTMEAEMYWQVDATHLVDFFYDFGNKDGDYLPIFRDIAVRAIKRVTTAHEAIEFFTDRDIIATEIRASIAESFIDHGVLIQLFAMNSLDLPDKFEDIIVTKVVTAQEVATEQWVKAINISLAEIGVIEGEGEALIQYKLASANAEAVKAISNAKSVGSARLRTAETDNFAAVQENLGMTGSEILKLRYSKIVQDLEASYHDDGRDLSFAMGYETPTALF